MGDYIIYDSDILEIDVHCEYVYRGIQLNALTLDRLRSSTCKYNSVYLTKLFWWWDVENIYRDAVSIDCTVDENISDKWLGEVAWGENVIDVW